VVPIDVYAWGAGLGLDLGVYHKHSGCLCFARSRCLSRRSRRRFPPPCVAKNRARVALVIFLLLSELWMSSYRTSLGLPPFGRTIKIITAALVGVWVATVLFLSGSNLVSAYQFLALSPPKLLDGYVFQLLTYMFMHDPSSPFQLLFVLLGIYLFHEPLERRLGVGGALRFALAAGIGGSVMTALMYPVSLWVKGAELSPITYGASSVSFGMLAAFCLMQKHGKVSLFFIAPMNIAHVLPLSLGIDFLIWISSTGDNFFPAHLGGAAAAWLWVNGWLKPSEWGERVREIRYRRRMAQDKKRGDNVRRGPWMN
jgi:membrane associated rhomboid family serine protease